MSIINRFSSRRQRLDQAFLSAKLKGAKSYRRIAGYFRSSIFELVGEEIAAIPQVRIVCNSELDAADVVVSKHVRETTLKERWNAAPAEVEALLHRDRYRKLHDLLTSGHVEIRVVPRDRVFIHGKAGVIEAADAPKPAFLAPSTKPRGPLPKTMKSSGRIPRPKVSPGLKRSLRPSGRTATRYRMASSRKSNESPTASRFVLRRRPLLKFLALRSLNVKVNVKGDVGSKTT